MPNQVRVLLGCWSVCRAGLPANCARTGPSLLPPVPAIVPGRFRCVALLTSCASVYFYQSSRCVIAFYL
jgi:hypothetical protein